MVNSTKKTENTQSLPIYEGFEKEWTEGSAIHPEIFNLNCEIISPQEAFLRIYENIHSSALHTNSGGLRQRWARELAQFEAGGDALWIEGVDPRTSEKMKWGRCKPGRKIKKWDWEKEEYKDAKYLSPFKAESRATFFRIPFDIWMKVSLRYGVAISGDNFWKWVVDNNIPVILVEGEKKAGCLLSLGYAAIALPGIWSGIRTPKDDLKRKIGPSHLIPDLEIFDGPEREIVILFDFESDSRKAENCNQAAWKLASCFKKAKTKIASLPGPEKGIDDFVVAGGDIESIIVGAKSLKQIKRERIWALNYPRNFILNRRYLGEIPSLPQSGLVGVKSPKGTGKTQALQGIVNAAMGQGRPVLLLTHRIVLGREICQHIGIPYIDENDDEQKIFGFGMCIDSLHPESKARFNPEDWEGAIIILDEVEQIIWHLLNSKTCKHKRAKILATFEQLINIALATDGLIIAQDADLSDYSINFIKEQYADEINLWICENVWKPETGWKIRSFDKKESLIYQAKKELLKGGKIWIQCDGQKAKSKFGTINLEKYFQKHFPDLRVLRIDSESTGDPDHPAFNCAGNINQIVGNYDIVICSPSLATGVSIDIKNHFTAVFGIFAGATPANEVRQALARVREPIPRYIFAAERAIGKIGNGSDNANEILQSQSEEIKFNIEILKQHDFASFDFESDEYSCPITTEITWAKMAARINLDAHIFRDSIIQGLIEEGHQIIGDSDSDDSNDLDNSSEIKEEIKEIREESWQENCDAIANAEDLSFEEFQILESKRSATASERFAKQKYRLKNRYQIEVNSALVKLDDQGYFLKILFHYLLSDGNRFLAKKDIRYLERKIQEGGGKICKKDLNFFSGKIQFLIKSKILQFMNPEREWNKDDAEVIDFCKLCKRYAKHIKSFFGININAQHCKNNPFKIIQSMLGILGLRLKGKRRREGGELKRFYSFSGSIFAEEGANFRDEIFQKWIERDENLESKSCASEAIQTHTQQALECVPQNSYNIF